MRRVEIGCDCEREKGSYVWPNGVHCRELKCVRQAPDDWWVLTECTECGRRCAFAVKRSPGFTIVYEGEEYGVACPHWFPQ